MVAMTTGGVQYTYIRTVHIIVIIPSFIRMCVFVCSSVCVHMQSMCMCARVCVSFSIFLGKEGLS